MDANTALTYFAEVFRGWATGRYGAIELASWQNPTTPDKEKFLMELMERYRTRRFLDEQDRETFTALCASRIRLLTGCPVGVVSREITEMIGVSGSQIPDDAAITEDLFFEPQGMLWFDRPLPDSAYTIRDVKGFSWSVENMKRLRTMRMKNDRQGIARMEEIGTMTGMMIMVQTYSTIPQTSMLVPLDTFYVPVGGTVGSTVGEVRRRWKEREDGQDNGQIENFIRSFVALLYFCKQRILLTGARVMPGRQIRRAVERQTGQEPILLTITLRARDYQRDRDSDGNPVDWSCRWLVRGHWRDQFYPSTGENRPLWIAPYIKGPDDKPLIVKERVYNIAR